MYISVFYDTPRRQCIKLLNLRRRVQICALKNQYNWTHDRFTVHTEYLTTHTLIIISLRRSHIICSQNDSKVLPEDFLDILYLDNLSSGVSFCNFLSAWRTFNGWPYMTFFVLNWFSIERWTSSSQFDVGFFVWSLFLTVVKFLWL